MEAISTAKKFTHLDLFSGIGGFALAASWVWGEQHHIHSFVEIEPFCQKVLKKHWPEVPIHDDIKTYKHDGTAIDLLTGGYPCQAFSTASHGKIVAEDLSGHMLTVIKKAFPKFIIAENVQRKTIDGFRKHLTNIGYRAERYRIGSDEIGADHKRNRWFCVAHANNESKLFSAINAKMEVLRGVQTDTWGWENYARSLWFSNGVSGGVATQYGNAIVPQVVVPIMQAIKETDESWKQYQQPKNLHTLTYSAG